MVLFLALIVGYIYWKGGLTELLALPFNNMGDFLAGAFAPLAFWWLVIGYWMQSLELEHNSKEMRNAVEQAREQAKALKSSEALSRWSVVNQVRQRFESDLDLAASHIVTEYIHSSIEGYWNAYSAGQKYIFCMHVIQNIDNYGPSLLQDMNEKFTSISEISNDYIRIYDDFMAALQELSCPLSILGFYENSPYGQLRTKLKEFVEGES
ncbi:MAG: hypothetical protein FD119_3567 [Stygiobacter sp.]|nr:MAG: hypothetical protein FD119_3567 [Stygiobacter sp.]